MKVHDRLTGSDLYSEEPFVIEAWKQNPERFTRITQITQIAEDDSTPPLADMPKVGYRTAAKKNTA